MAALHLGLLAVPRDWDDLIGDLAAALDGLAPGDTDVSLMWLSHQQLWSAAVGDGTRAAAQTGPTAAVAITRARLRLAAGGGDV